MTVLSLECGEHTTLENPCPTCDHCGMSQCLTPTMAWNGNTGCHIACELKIAAANQKPRYVEGEQYRVLMPGARLEGFLLHGEELVSGWSRGLLPGEVLTCKGWQVVDVGQMTVRGVQWTGVKVPEAAVSVQVWPFDGLFRPFPLTGLLEPYVEDSGENLAAIEEQIEEGHEVDLTGYLKDTSALVAREDDDEVVDLTHG